MRALVLSTYELGHQPLHAALPAAALTRAGHDVRCVDLSLDELGGEDIAWADAVAVSVPMHTALRLAHQAAAAVRRQRPAMPVCFFGLYAAVDDGSDGPGRADRAVAGEYLPGVLDFFARAGSDTGTTVLLGRQPTVLPARRALPILDRYATLVVGEGRRLAGYVEASRGCNHRCRHCPVPVVYDGRTRVVAVDDVLADVAQLVSLGAEHVSFGDPDFLSGPHHARRVAAAVHGAFPALTFDVTVKVEHVLAHRGLWPELATAGCLFVVSAFESASEAVLEILDKGHTAADAVEAVRVLRAAGIEPRPSFVPFTPWTTADDVVALLDLVAHCDLVANVDPVQYSIRLLVPPGSLLLDSGHLDGLLGPYDGERLSWTWASSDPRLDRLQTELAAIAEAAGAQSWDPLSVHQAVRASTATYLARPHAASPPPTGPGLESTLAVDARPRLSEPWFCCAEPTTSQLAVAGGGAPFEAAGGR